MDMKQPEKQISTVPEMKESSPMDNRQPVKKSRLRRSLFIVLPLLTLAIVLGGSLLWKTTNTPQKAHAASSTFLIKNTGGNYCLDGGASDGHPYFNTCDRNNVWQQWVSERNNLKNGSGYRTFTSLRNIGSNKCLDHANEQETTGFHPYLYECYYEAGQAFAETGISYSSKANTVTEVIQAVGGNAVAHHALDGYNGGGNNTPYLFPLQTKGSGQIFYYSDIFQIWELDYV